MKPLLTALFILLVSASLAQQSDLHKTIQLKKGQMRIDAIMQEIYQQGSLKFSFNSQQINPSKQVQIKNERITIGAILNQVEQTAGVKFKVVGRHIVLLNQAKEQKINTANAGKHKETNTTVKPGSVAKNNKAQKGNKLRKIVATTPKSNQINGVSTTNQNKTATIANDSLLVKKRIDSVSGFSVKGIPVLSRQFTLDTTPTISQPAIPSLVVVPDKEREKPFWISAGATSNELSFVNPSVRGGYKNLYAVLTLENCTCSPSYRWGVGIEQWADRIWQLRQTLTTGTTAALYPAATLPEVLVKNRHYKWSTLLTRVVWNKVELQVGPVVNVLHTRYFSNDGEGNQQKVAAGGLLPETMDGDKVFTSTEAPYTLFNTYKKDRVANWKGWIGAEVGIYYKLPFSIKKKVSTKSKS